MSNFVKRPDAQSIEFLTFEGGGGRGITYVGALQALEELGMLPIGYEVKSQNDDTFIFDQFSKTPRLIKRTQIKGISGSSAGAITAFLLVLGHSYKTISDLLNDKTAFDAFYDEPFPGEIRSVEYNKYRRTLNPNLITSNSKITPSGLRTKRLKQFLEDFKLWAIIKFGLPRMLKSLEKDHPFIKKLLKRPEGNFYLYNIFYDRGVFPGFAMRDYLVQRFADFYVKLPSQPKNGRARSAHSNKLRERVSSISFRQLKQLTGLDLVLTGTNVTTRKPKLFSAELTPDFPVIDAVCISSSFPIFKPYWVDNCKGVESGFWIDGGVLNNLPIHAFDDQTVGDFTPLNPNVLGLRLSSTQDKSSVQERPAEEIELSDILVSYVGDLLNTFLYPSEEGQFRTKQERAQTIELDTGDLKTTVFAPPKRLSDGPIKRAHDAVISYFS